MSIEAADIFTYPWWVYVSIPPLGAALVGWATKILALKMMFYPPVEFKASNRIWDGRARSPPSGHRKMAAVAVDSLTSGILKPEEMFDKIDPDELVKELGGATQRRRNRTRRHDDDGAAAPSCGGPRQTRSKT